MFKAITLTIDWWPIAQVKPCERNPRLIPGRTIEKLFGCLPRVPAPPAADMDAQLLLQRPQSALQGTDDAGGDAGGMPVHAHDGTKGLEPEGMRQPPQELISAVVVDDGLADDRAQACHALCQPVGHLPAMEGQVCAAGSVNHRNAVLMMLVLNPSMRKQSAR